MSPELKKFLTNWLEWVDQGAPEGKPFNREDGLCASSAPNPGHMALYFELKNLLFADFKDSDPGYPFGGAIRYWEDHDENTQHLNELRVEWVRRKLS